MGLGGGGLTRSPLTSLLQAQSPSQREAKVQRTGPDRLVAQRSLRGAGSIICTRMEAAKGIPNYLALQGLLSCSYVGQTQRWGLL
jgi:hypothetical protein